MGIKDDILTADAMLLREKGVTALTQSRINHNTPEPIDKSAAQLHKKMQCFSLATALSATPPSAYQ